LYCNRKVTPSTVTIVGKVLVVAVTTSVWITVEAPSVVITSSVCVVVKTSFAAGTSSVCVAVKAPSVSATSSVCVVVRMLVAVSVTVVGTCSTMTSMT
jgi:hypothetical protein